jgi:AcrR family transcriptional regulator
MPESAIEQPQLGRRERKKAATHKALADAALRLFLERGYDAVGIREIAEAADLSVTTLFKHFPSKEALVFDQEGDVKDALLSAVRDRGAGRSIPAALRDYVIRHRLPHHGDDPRFAQFKRLIEQTPALREYSRKMWMRYELALAAEIADDVGAPHDDPACRALAHFSIEVIDLVFGGSDPELMVERAFDLLEHGWHAVGGPAADTTA